MTVLGTPREPSPEALARSVGKAVCPDCVDGAGRVRETGDLSAFWSKKDRSSPDQ
ncbi:hypothetical protein ABZ297_34185 [Nonomuraea sp. NPDC005983]|uniref:hypothetical protein n=1 Tax=Nonomuraea sp. NPDC005983 TaxID=3155595 RepID=UPI0033B07D86